MPDPITFKTEAERVEAMNALGEDPKNLDKLEEIRKAEIKVDGAGPANPPEGGDQEKPPGEKPPEAAKPPAEKTPEGADAGSETFTVNKKDLPEGYTSLGHVLKAFGEQKALIARQGTYIQELSQKPVERPALEQAALDRAGNAQQALEDAGKGGASGASQGTMADIAAITADIKKIETLQDELEKEAEKDPDAAYTPEYQKKARALSRLQTANLTVLANLLGSARTEIQEAKKQAADAVAGSQRSQEEEQEREVLNNTYKEIDTIDIPEYKLSKPVKDVNTDFIVWSNGVALALYGRPAANVAEKFAALDQLQLKNPEIINKCRLMGIATEPTEDIKKYLEICKYLDYRDGYRLNPITKEYDRLFKYDSKTKQQVPLVLPSIKDAIQKKRLDEGFYEKKADNAFQQGAESVTQAAGRRDKGAIELDTGRDQGQIAGGTQKWANDTLLSIDPEVAMYKYRKGDKTAIEELNKARKILNMEPLTFEE